MRCIEEPSCLASHCGGVAHFFSRQLAAVGATTSVSLQEALILTGQLSQEQLLHEQEPDEAQSQSAMTDG